MTQSQYVVLAKSAPGQESALENWYREQHLPDVARVPGVTAARCYRVDTILAGPTNAGWAVLAIYEITADDPLRVLDEIKTRAGTPDMPMSADFMFEGSLQILAS